MSVRATVILFAVLFSLGVFAIVVLPFALRRGPAEPAPARGENGEAVAMAAPELGVFRSDDGGRTWQAKSTIEARDGLATEFRVNRLVPHPANPGTIYLLTDGNGLWVSSDRGERWIPVRDARGVLDPRSNVLALAINPNRAAEWYVAVFQQNRGRVVLTEDGGSTFREVYFTPVERFGVFNVHYDRSSGAVLIATGQGGLLESRDRGRTWRVVRWFADGLVRLMVDPSNPSMRYVATPRGSLFRTMDGGASWADITGSFASFSGARQDQRWTIDASGTLYLGSRHGLLRSRDGGRTFEGPPIIIPPDALPVLAMAVGPTNTRRILVSAGSQLYESRDDGQTWAILPPPSSQRITHILFDRERPDTLYAVAQP